MSNESKECKNCGAELKFEPETESLKCPYCGVENEIRTDSDIKILENDYLKQISELETSALSKDTVEHLSLKCETCGAMVSLSDNQTAGDCLFCGSHTSAQEV